MTHCPSILLRKLPDELPLDHKPIATTCPKHTRRPACHTHNLTPSKGVTTVTGNNDANEAGGVLSDTPHAFTISEDPGMLEHAFTAAESSCAEALLSRAPPEVRQPPNQPHWEMAILKGLAMPKSAGTWCLEPGLDFTPSGSTVIGSGGAFKFIIDSKTLYFNSILMHSLAWLMQEPPGL
jgi:hypothetical protein